MVYLVIDGEEHRIAATDTWLRIVHETRKVVFGENEYDVGEFEPLVEGGIGGVKIWLK